MDTDMVTKMTESRFLRNRPFALILTVLFLVIGLTLTGCKSGPVVSADNASEVALDDAGFDAGEVTDLTVSDSGSGYSISFATSKGVFHYEISPKGLIEERKFEKSIAPTSEKKPEPTKNDSKQNSQASKSSVKPSSPETPSAASTASSQKERSESEEMAVTLALNNAGLEESEVTNIQVTGNGDEATVTFNYGNYENVVTVDMISHTVTGSYVR